MQTVLKWKVLLWGKEATGKRRGERERETWAGAEEREEKKETEAKTEKEFRSRKILDP